MQRHQPVGDPLTREPFADLLADPLAPLEMLCERGRGGLLRLAAGLQMRDQPACLPDRFSQAS
ncbi:MAG: hypothetical protein ACLP8S_08160 [Solirubrobacteraceae bacterium]